MHKIYKKKNLFYTYNKMTNTLRSWMNFWMPQDEPALFYIVVDGYRRGTLLAPFFMDTIVLVWNANTALSLGLLYVKNTHANWSQYYYIYNYK